jgi:hypothetical protein
MSRERNVDQKHVRTLLWKNWGRHGITSVTTLLLRVTLPGAPPNRGCGRLWRCCSDFVRHPPCRTPCSSSFHTRDTRRAQRTGHGRWRHQHLGSRPPRLYISEQVFIELVCYFPFPHLQRPCFWRHQRSVSLNHHLPSGVLTSVLRVITIRICPQVGSRRIPPFPQRPSTNAVRESPKSLCQSLSSLSHSASLAITCTSISFPTQVSQNSADKSLLPPRLNHRVRPTEDDPRPTFQCH